MDDREAAENPFGFLSRAGAVVVAFASVVGSSIVVIPAAVLAESGSAAIVVWIMTALLCIPMIMLFRDTVLHSAGAPDPLRYAVHRGLGPSAGRMVPLCVTLAVVVGLPTNAVIGARLLEAVVPLPVPPIVIAVVILGIAVGTNLVGGRMSAGVQAWAAGILVVVLAAAALGAGRHPIHAPDLVPEATALLTVPSGMLVAFWACVGFENLTFVARDMRNPRRDFGFVAVVAMVLLVSLGILLSIVATLRLDSVDPLTGVIDAVQASELGSVAATIVAVAGVGAVLLNALAWVRGCALVVENASREGIVLTGALVSPGNTPRRAICALSMGFTSALVVLWWRPNAVIDLLAAASAVFVMIYVLCVIAFLRRRPPLGWTLTTAIVLIVMIAVLLGSGWRSLYGLAVLIVAALIAGPIFRSRTSTTASVRAT